MHYKKAPRLRGGAALHLHRVERLRSTAGGMFHEIKSRQVEARICEIRGRRSPFLLAEFSQSGPLRQGFASPRQTAARP